MKWRTVMDFEAPDEGSAEVAARLAYLHLKQVLMHQVQPPQERAVAYHGVRALPPQVHADVHDAAADDPGQRD